MIAAISNIFLDLIMVVGLKLGIVGAALATDISQLISCIFIWGFLIRSEEVYKLKIRRFVAMIICFLKLSALESRQESKIS